MPAPERLAGPDDLPQRSFPLHDHRQRHESQHRCLQPGVFAQQDCDIANEGRVPDHATDDIF